MSTSDILDLVKKVKSEMPAGAFSPVEGKSLVYGQQQDGETVDPSSLTPEARDVLRLVGKIKQGSTGIDSGVAENLAGSQGNLKYDSREQAIIDRNIASSANDKLAGGAAGDMEVQQRRQQRAYAEQAPPEVAAQVKELLSSSGDRNKVLDIVRNMTPEQREETLRLAPGIAQQLGDDRGGAIGRTLGALSLGVSKGVSQPLMELVGAGGTKEEIEYIRKLDALASQEFAPARPGDPWYEAGPLQAAQMAPWMATVVGAGGLGRAAGQGAGTLLARGAAAGVPGAKAAFQAAGAVGRVPTAIGLKGATTKGVFQGAGTLAGITSAAFPGQYAQEVDQLKELGMEDDWKLRLLAGGTATVAGMVEGIVPNPFGGTVSLKQGAMKAARQYLWEALKKAPPELGEEYLQGVTSGLGQYVAQYIDKDAKEKTIADAFANGWEQTKEAALPMAFLLGVPAVGGAGLSAIRARRYQLEQIRAKNFVSESDAKAAGIEGNSRRERMANVESEIEQLGQQEAEASKQLDQEFINQQQQAQAPQPQAGVQPEQTVAGSQIDEAGELVPQASQADLDREFFERMAARGGNVSTPSGDIVLPSPVTLPSQPAAGQPSVSQQTPASFAARMARGEQMTSPEDQQYRINNAAEIEAELQKLMSPTDTATAPPAEQPQVQPLTDKEFADQQAGGNVATPEVPPVTPTAGDPFGETTPPAEDPWEQPESQEPPAQAEVPIEQVPDSVFSAFPDMLNTTEGYISLDQFTQEERDALRNAGLVQSISKSDGSTYEGVDPERLWPERQKRAASNSAKRKQRNAEREILKGVPSLIEDKDSDVAWGQLSDDARSALLEWTSGSGRNGSTLGRLREAAKALWQGVKGGIKSDVDLLREIFENGKTGRDKLRKQAGENGKITLLRGLRKGQFGSRPAIESFTTDLRTARNFAGQDGTVERVEVDPDDVIYVIGGAESEVLVKNTGLEGAAQAETQAEALPELKPAPTALTPEQQNESDREFAERKAATEINGKTVEQMRNEGMSEDEIQEEESKQNYFNVVGDVTKASDKDLNRAYGFSGILADYHDRNGRSDMAESVRREQESMKAEIKRRNAQEDQQPDQPVPPSDIASAESDMDAAMREEFKKQLGEKDDKQPPKKRPPRKDGKSKKPSSLKKSKGKARKEADNLWDELIKKSQNKLLTGLDPELLTLAARIAIKELEYSAISFAEFVERSVAKVPDTLLEKLKPYLESAWRTAYDSEMTTDAGGKFDDYIKKPEKSQPKTDELQGELRIPVAGQPFTFTALHNKEKSPDMGSRFGQDKEPAGRYVVAVSDDNTAADQMPDKYDRREVTFQNPLVVDFGGGYQEATNWKQVLSDRYGGLTGKPLSEAIRKDGYDGIVTVEPAKGPNRPAHTSEIVDLRTGKTIQKAEPSPAEKPAAAESEVDKTLRQAGLNVEKLADGTWQITGNTYEHSKEIGDVKREIRELGGYWDKTGKRWTFKADPRRAIADRLVSKGAGPEPADEGVSDEQMARERARRAEDEKPDVQTTSESYVASVDQSTRDLIGRGLKFGMTEEVVSNQIEDVGRVVNAAENGRPMFVIGSAPGTGKTFVLGGVIRELRKRGFKKFVYVTQNQDLVSQVQNNLADYGLEGVEFVTYTKARTAPPSTSGAVLLLDEAHSAKNLDRETGKKLSSMVQSSDFTVYATATPFENVTEAEYIGYSGIFDDLKVQFNRPSSKPGGRPFRNELFGFKAWAWMFGANVYFVKQEGRNGETRFVPIVWWDKQQTSEEDQLAANEWLKKRGVYVQRPMALPVGMVNSELRSIEADPYWADISNQVVDIYADAESESESNIERGQIKAHKKNVLKRLLEASKVDAAIARAKKLIGKGETNDPQVIIFVNTKADTDIGTYTLSEPYRKEYGIKGKDAKRRYTPSEMDEMMQRWYEAKAIAKEMGDSAGPPPFAPFVHKIAMAMDAAGVMEKFPSVIDKIMDAFPGQAVEYSGRTASQNSGNLAKWKNNEAKLIVATMDKGGTGLSFHDTTGKMPSRYQVNMNLPWSGTKVEQVSGRLARYGTAKPVNIEWLFASNIPFDRELSKTVGSRMRSMAAAVQGRKSGEAKQIKDFDFEESSVVDDNVPVAPWSDATVEDEGRWAGTTVNVSAKGKEEGYAGKVVRVLNKGETIEVQRDGFDSAIRVPAERVSVIDLVDSKAGSSTEQADRAAKILADMESNQEKMRQDKKRREGEKLADWVKAFEGSPREVTAAKDLFRKDFEKARENGVSDDRLVEIIDHGRANDIFTEKEAADLKGRIMPAAQQDAASQMHYPDGSAYRKWMSRRHRLGDHPTSYLSGHSSAKVREAAKQNPGLGLVITPANPSYVDHAGDYSHIMVDNGAFSEFTGKAPFSEDKFFALLDRIVAAGLKDKVQFVVVPDRVGDWAGTNKRWDEFKERVKSYSMPLAYVGQDGIEQHLDKIPWDEFDVFFIGGSTPWKVGYNPKGDYKDFNRPTDDELRKAGDSREYANLIREVKRRGKKIHMGRVNSFRRIEIANYGMQVDSADGNYIGAAPDKNLPVVLDWLNDTGGGMFKQRHELLLDRAAPYVEKGESYKRDIADPAMRLQIAIAKGNAIDSSLVQTLTDELEVRLDYWEPILQKAKEENEARDQEEPEVDSRPKEGDGRTPQDQGATRRIVGAKTKVGKRKAHYEVIEIDHLVGSHYPFGMAINDQFPEEWQKYQRRYESLSEEQKQEVWMPKDGFDPSQVIDATRFHDRGPTMVVEKDGKLYVVGGTRRYMMLANLYRSFEDKAMDYHNALVAEAEMFGLDVAAVNGMDKPILIRVIDEPGDDIPKLVDELNADAGFQKDPAAEAASLGRGVGKNTIAILRGIGDEETLAKFLDRKGVDVVYAMVSDNPELKTKIPSWVKGKSLTKDAKLAVQKAIMGAVISDATLINQASPRILQSVNGALAEILLLNQKGGEWSLSERIKEAITYDAAFRTTGKASSDRNIEYWMSDPQMTFFEGFNKDPNSDGYRLWRYLLEFGGARKFRIALQNTMLKEARLDDTSGGLFADLEESMSGNEAFELLIKSGISSGPSASSTDNDLLMQLDDRITDPPQSLFQSDPDIDATIRSKALDLGIAANEAGITAFDDFVRYSLERNGEKLTRYMGAYLAMVGKTVGMTGVRPVKDILGVPMTQAEYVQLGKEAFAGSPQVTPEQVEAGIEAAMLTGLPQMAVGFAPAGSPVPAQGLKQGATQTDTPAFKAWFGDSKVVDEDGEPLVVYHGTGTSTNVLLPRPDVLENEWGNRAPDSLEGVFFTSSTEDASLYAKSSPDGRQVMPVYLRIERPARIDDPPGVKEIARKLRKAKEDGRDGAIITYENYTHYVVFEPTQIKSATGNRGTFDPNNPNMLYQEGKQVDADTIPKAVLSKMSGRLRSMGYDSRGAEDVRRGIKERSLLEFNEDWIAAYQFAIGSEQARQDKAAAKKDLKNVNWARLSELGTTSDPNEAGYIKPDGELADFSGKREGGQRGTRSFDHREAGGTAGMQEVIAYGWVRMDENSGSLDIAKMPTPAQLSAITRMAQRKFGEIVLDLEDGLGEWRETDGYYINPRRRWSQQYPEGTKPQRIINDIKKFFGGDTPNTLFQTQQQGGNVKGWTKFISGTRALIGATNKADISTVIHEYAHVIRRFLLNRDVPQDQRIDITDEEIAMLEEKCGVKDGNWDVPAEEKFAKMWEQYFFEGKSPNTLLDSLFEKISRWMQQVYQSAMSITGGTLDPEVRKLFDKMVQRQLPADQRTGARSRDGGKDKPPIYLPVTSDQWGDNLTSLANAAANATRERLKLPSLTEPASEGFQEWLDAAVVLMRNDPTYANRLVKELQQSSRSIDDVDVAVLNLHYRHLKNLSDAAANRLFKAIDGKQGDVAIVQARRESDALINEIEDFTDMTKKVGTEAGRALVARKIALAEDYTLGNLLLKARVANAGQPLSEAQLQEVRELADKIAKLEGDLAKEIQEKDDLARKLAAKESIDDTQKQVGKPVRNTATNRAVKKVESFVNKFVNIFGKRDDTTTLQQTEDEAMAEDGEEVIKSFVEAGVYSFGEFMSKFKAVIKGDVPVAARAALRKAWDKLKAQGDIPAPDMSDERQTAELRRLAKMVERNLVEFGITDPEEVIDGVHEALQEVFEDVTRREAMDAMSGYGQYSTPSQEPADKIIRDLNAQYQQMAKKDDMQQGIAPKKSGRGRDEPSDELRKLIREVNEMKRNSKYFITDPEAQLKTIFQATRTALRNRIYDLNKAIKAKEPIPGRTPNTFEGEQAKEIESLRKQRDELMADYKATFPKPGLTFEQRAAIAERAVDREITKIEQQLASGNVAAKERAEPVSTPALKDKQNRLESLRAQREAVREMQMTDADREQRADRLERQAEKAYVANLLNRIADYEDRKAQGYFGPKPKKEPRTLSPREVELSRQLVSLKDEFFRYAAEYRLRNMSKVERFWDRTKETMHLSRAIMTSFDLSAVFRQGGIASLAHPRLAAAASREMWNALWRGGAEFDTMDKISKDELYTLAMRAGLSITTDSGKITRQEEAYMGRWAKWGIGKKGTKINELSLKALFFVAPSARSYTTFLNSMRFRVFKYMVSNLGAGGEVTIDEAKVIASYVNAATGRAELGKFNQAAANLNTVFFAPRYVASRFQYLAMPFYLLPSTKVSGRVKKMIAMEYARHAMGLAAFLGLSVALASLLTDDEEEKPTVEFDPRSSDFMKLKIGDTRIDPMAGLSQTVTLIGQMTTGQKKGLRGDIKDLYGENRKFGDPDLWDVGTGFLRKKLAPIPGAIVDLRVGENVIGEKETVLSTTTDLFVPLSFQEAGETMKARGLVGGSVVTALSLLGMGGGTYGPKTQYATADAAKREELFKKDLENVKWDDPDLAYKDFLTTAQLDKFNKQREGRKQSLVFSAAADPKRKDYNSDETFKKSVEERDKALDAVIKAGMGPKETQLLLIAYYKRNYGSAYEVRGGVYQMKESLANRLRTIRRKLNEKKTPAK